MQEQIFAHSRDDVYRFLDPHKYGVRLNDFVDCVLISRFYYILKSLVERELVARRGGWHVGKTEAR